MTFSRDITLKRVFDVATATGGIVLASPLLLAGSLAGLAQLYGGTILSHRESLEYDRAYIAAYRQRTAFKNLVNDIAIAAKTLPAIIKHYRDPHFYSAPKTSVTPANKPGI